MMVVDSMMAGARAVQVGTESLNRSAHEIATRSVRSLDAVGEPPAGQQPATDRPVPKTDLIQPLVEQNQALYQAQAGVVVMRAANRNMGQLFSMFA